MTCRRRSLNGSSIERAGFLIFISDVVSLKLHADIFESIVDRHRRLTGADGRWRKTLADYLRCGDGVRHVCGDPHRTVGRKRNRIGMTFVFVGRLAARSYNHKAAGGGHRHGNGRRPAAAVAGDVDERKRSKSCFCWLLLRYGARSVVGVSI